MDDVDILLRRVGGYSIGHGNKYHLLLVQTDRQDRSWVQSTDYVWGYEYGVDIHMMVFSSVVVFMVCSWWLACDGCSWHVKCCEGYGCVVERKNGEELFGKRLW